MRTGSADPIVVQIPPETSPLMLPTQGHRRRVVYSHQHADGRDVEEEDYQLEPNYRSSDLVDADDLEFVAPGQWDGLGDPNLGGHGQDHSQYPAFGDDDDDDDDVPDFDMMDDGDHDVEDWTLEDGHVDGVPCCNVRLDAK